MALGVLNSLVNLRTAAGFGFELVLCLRCGEAGGCEDDEGGGGAHVDGWRIVRNGDQPIGSGS